MEITTATTQKRTAMVGRYAGYLSNTKVARRNKIKRHDPSRKQRANGDYKSQKSEFIHSGSRTGSISLTEEDP